MTDGWRRAIRPRLWPGLAEASATLVWVHLSLRRHPPAALLAWAAAGRGATAGNRGDPDRAATVARVVWQVGAASRHLVPVPCLSRSIALARMLSRRGITSDIRIGVRTRGAALEAHAWVEIDGRPINDALENVRGYEAFDRPMSDIADLVGRFR